MARLLCITLVAFLVSVKSNELLRSEELLEAFKSSLQVDNLLSSAANISRAVDKLVREADQTYEEVLLTTANKTLIASTLNGTVKPYEEIIRQASLLANTTAARSCVAKAQAAIRQLVNSGGQQSYKCAINTRMKMYNFTSTVAALDIGESSSGAREAYAAVSKCPSRFLLNQELDLNSAKDCYTAAAAELTEYIESAYLQFLQLQDDLKVLEINGSNCLTGQADVTVKDSKGVIDFMITCGRSAGVLLLPANVLAAVTAGVKDIDDFIAILKDQILRAYAAVNTTRAKLVALRQNINVSITAELEYAQNLTDFVEDFLKDPQDKVALRCIKTARRKYKYVWDTGVEYSAYCIDDAEEIMNASKLVEAEARLRVLIADASSKAAANCMSFPGLTKASVEQCMTNALTNLQQLAWDDYQVIDELIEFADEADADIEICLANHLVNTSSGSRDLLYDLHTCLQREGIVFRYE